MFTSVFTADTEVVDVAAADVVSAVAEVVESTVVPVDDVAAFGLEGEEGEGEGVPLLSLTCPFTLRRVCRFED